MVMKLKEVNQLLKSQFSSKVNGAAKKTSDIIPPLFGVPKSLLKRFDKDLHQNTNFLVTNSKAPHDESRCKIYIL